MRRSVALISQLSQREFPSRNPRAWNPLLSLSVSTKYFPSQELLEQFTLTAEIYPGCNTNCDSLFCACSVSIQYLLCLNLVPPCPCLFPLSVPQHVSPQECFYCGCQATIHTGVPGVTAPHCRARLLCLGVVSVCASVSVSVSWKCCLCVTA